MGVFYLFVGLSELTLFVEEYQFLFMLISSIRKEVVSKLNSLFTRPSTQFADREWSQHHCDMTLLDCCQKCIPVHCNWLAVSLMILPRALWNARRALVAMGGPNTPEHRILFLLCSGEHEVSLANKLWHRFFITFVYCYFDSGFLLFVYSFFVVVFVYEARFLHIFCALHNVCISNRGLSRDEMDIVGGQAHGK